MEAKKWSMPKYGNTGKLTTKSLIQYNEQDPETGLYYYGARYLDPRTSRWISTDPAVGEYVPQAPINDEAKKHNQNLPGMGGVFNYVNLHVYHYAGNNPVKLVDPEGRYATLENVTLDQAITAMEMQIQNKADKSYKLGDLINTDQLAIFMLGNLNNPDYIDSAVAAGIGNMNHSELSAFLGNMNVYAVSDWSDIESIIDTLGAPKAPSGGGMLSVGNNIYVRNTINLNAMNDLTADLLGHETIHGLQAAGMGKIAFLSAYRQKGSYINSFEITAYNWGGDSHFALKPQLLPANPDWWRK